MNNIVIDPFEEQINRLENTKQRILERQYKGELTESQARLRLEKINEELDELYIKQKERFAKKIEIIRAIIGR